MKTIYLKPADVKPEWLLVDATDLVVGRLAARLAMILMGKHRPDYTPHVASGDFVVVVNAEKVKFTGNKWADKEYQRYTGFHGGRKTIKAEMLREKSPETILREAVRRMLPKNKLAYRMLQQLKVYEGTEHPHQAQQPKPVNIKS
ncbi:MAG: 50S ribosomal protein L13 [Planctomycetota bacterium]